MTLQKEWISLAADIRKAGLDVFATADVPMTEKRSADPMIVVLELLARSLSNVKSVLTLLKDQDIVEARVITRCCLENFYWAVGVADGRDDFVRKMVEDDMNHRRAIGQTIFWSTRDLDDAVKGRLQTFMRDSKKRFADARSLNPKQVAHLRADIGRSHMFYGHLSMDAHPSTTTLKRYLVIGHAEGDGIDVVPAIRKPKSARPSNISCWGPWASVWPQTRS